MGNFADRAMCLVNEDMDITGADLAKKVLKPSFGKAVPIVCFEKDGVANGHNPYVISMMGGLSTQILQIGI